MKGPRADVARGVRDVAYLGAYLLGLAAAFVAALVFVRVAVQDDAAVVQVAQSARPTAAAVPSTVPSAQPSTQPSTVPSAEPSAVPSPSAAAPAAAPTPGLSPAAGPPYVLVLDRTEIGPAAEESLRLQVLGADGGSVGATGADGGALHVVLVRRDLYTYQEVAGVADGAGGWTVRVTAVDAGPYRVLADVVPPGATEGITLGADLTVSGEYTPAELPSPSTTAATRRYTVAMTGGAAPGVEGELAFSVTESGAGVMDLLPYDAGAVGSLAVFRTDDLARAAVSPHTFPAATGMAGPEIRFGVTFPGPGTYRAFLGFQRLGGTPHTVTFTVTVPN